MAEVLPRPALDDDVLIYDLFHSLLDERNTLGVFDVSAVDLLVVFEVAKRFGFSVGTEFSASFNWNGSTDFRVSRAVTNLRDRSSGQEVVTDRFGAEVVEIRVSVVHDEFKCPLEDLGALGS